ncbi:MAG: SET domain-containing protein-lysine N-methyltransferase [Spirochaetes bacterium]|nr:SET domain-containing protein-lysine N-methyltransferase [Spirochaetota bacterium]
MSIKKDWRSPKIDIRTSPVEGRGMFANSLITPGEKVVVWDGEYTDEVGAIEARGKNMLVMQWDDDLYSYEVSGTDDGYFINHSCDPNVWMIDAHTLVARRDIKTGEELMADYALWEADENYLSEWHCMCGSPICRGRVTGKDWKNIELQERYKGHFSPLLNKRILRLRVNVKKEWRELFHIP